MKTKLALFGTHYDMAPRTNRRRLVAIFYGVFAALLIANWTMGSRTGGGFLTIEFTVLVGPILGGYFAGSSNLFGRPGLVEPFSGGKALRYQNSAGASGPKSLFHPLVDDDPELRTDERALRRREHAHYLAHGFLGGVITAAFLLEFFNHSILREVLAGFGVSSASLDRLVYSLLQVAYIAFMTLPQAILLWTEPDLETAAG